MPGTYESIASQTLSSAAASITFSSIPATFTDLRVVVTAIGTGSNIALRLNGDGATNYSQRDLLGNGTAASSGSLTGFNDIYLTTGSIAATPSLLELDIASYAGSAFKTTLSRWLNDKNGSGVVYMVVGLWRSTAAINEIRLAASFSAGTIAELIGIKNA
jgi:hypothetical protein